MPAIKRITVADDSHERLAAAMEKAVLIEHGTEAEIEIVQTVYSATPDDPSTGLPEKERAHLIDRMKATETQVLQSLVDQFKEHVETVSARVIWAKDTAAAIASEAQQTGSDLIIKPVARHNALGDLFHTPSDWALMREASCPVLTIRNSPWKPEPTILVAVDAGDTKHESLNVNILETAKSLCTAVGGSLHIAAVYPSLGQAVNDYQVAIDYQPLKADMRAMREAAISRWVDDLSLDVASIMLEEGDPAKTIARLSSSTNADITVLGTEARHGVKKLFIGNTAENIVSQVACDVLTVRDLDS